MDEDVIASIMHRMSTEGQYSTDATIEDYADASCLITDYGNKRMWVVRIHSDDSVSLPSDMYMDYEDRTYQGAITEAQRLMEQDLRHLITVGYDPCDAVDILDGRYEVRLSERFRDIMNTIRGAIL